MSYLDIINKLAIKLNKNIKNSSNKLDFFSYHFEKLFNIFYEKFIAAIEEFEEVYDENIYSTIDMFENYDKLLDDYNETHKRNIDNAYSVYTFNVMKYKEKLDLKNKHYEESTKNNNDKIYFAQSKHRDRINNQDINKNLKNNSYKQLIEPIKARYSEIITYHNDKRDLTKNKIHSKNSKELYQYCSANANYIKNVNNKLLFIEDEIEKAYNVLSNKQDENKKLKLNNTVITNEKVNEQNKTLQQERKMSENQCDVEINALRVELEDVRENYSGNRHEIIEELKNNFINLDNEIDQINKNMEDKINIIKGDYAKQRYLEERKYNQLIIRNMKKVVQGLISKNFAVKENSKAYEAFTHLEVEHNKIIDNIRSSILVKVNELKKNKYFLDLERKHNIAVENFNEKMDLIQLNKKIELIEKEKGIYNDILDNNNSIKINLIKIDGDTKEMLLDQSIREFELTESNNISKLETDAKILKNDIELSKELEDIIKKRYENNDLLTSRVNDLTSILLIEKNKYLLSYNLDIINKNILLNNNQHRFFVTIENIKLQKNLDTYNANKDYLLNSLNNFKEEIQINIDIEKLQYEYNVHKYDIEHTYDISKAKNGLNLNKLDIDYSFLVDIVHNIDLLSSYSFSFFKSNLERVFESYEKTANKEVLINDLDHFTKTFLNHLSELYLAFYNDLRKIIDSRILFEVGKKYELLINEVNKNYEVKQAQITERSEHIKETIINYRSTIHKYYYELKKLELAKKNLKKESLNNKPIITEIRRLNKIINNNTKLVSNFEITLSRLPKLLEELENEHALKISLIEASKKKNVSNSFSTIEQLNVKTDELVSDLLYIQNSFSNIDFNNNEVVYKALRLIIKRVNKYITKYFKNIYKIVDNFNLSEIKNINKVKKSSINTYNRDLSNINRSFKHDLNVLNNNLRECNDNLKLMTLNYQNTLNAIILECRKASTLANRKYIIETKDILKRFEISKEKYYNLFEACDVNASNINNTILNELKQNEDDYIKNTLDVILKHKLIKEKLIEENKAYIKSNNQALVLIPSTIKNERKRIKNAYEQENNNLNLENKKLDELIKLNNQNSINEISIYKKELQIEIDLEKKKYLNEYKVLKDELYKKKFQTE